MLKTYFFQHRTKRRFKIRKRKKCSQR